MKLLFSIITFACVANIFVKCELFTSIAHLQSALWAEYEIAEEIRSYVAAEEKRLEKLKSLADDFEKHSQEASSDPAVHIGNPVNAYLFMKRFTLDWDRYTADLLTESTSDNGVTFKEKINALKEELPTYEDLNGAVAALLRLQDTYKLDTDKLAHGDIRGIQSSELSAQDCFEVGRIAYNRNDYYHTTLWMEQTMGRLEEEKNKTVAKKDILDYLSFSHYKVAEDCFYIGRYAYLNNDFYHSILWLQTCAGRQKEQNKTSSTDRATVLDYLAYSMLMQGNVRHALSLTDELLTLVPNHERAKSNKGYYEKMIEEEEQKAKKRGDDGMEPEKKDKTIINNPKQDDYHQTEEFLTYEKLCRGENTRNHTKQYRLKCRYLRNHPILYLHPAKEETVHHNPDIFLYHDVVSDKEMEMIKSLATPKLDRATVHNPRTGKLENANYRISKSAWLKNSDDEVIQTINKKIGAITGLNMDTAEDLQIANYGIGGHYEPHFDFARKEEPDAFKSLGSGNRIATWLTYMTDVPAGGATVFTNIGVKLWPQKGTAAFWYNLYKNGDGIYDTRHAACPVLVGEKWVTNKWIHERGQEFKRPCSLKESE
ncbi:hypothetical protein KUTeg_003429 [Tegillarca granosa]|uniref:procollagen-proline 4-dioxygenase n=1 Tax=Tegillarca granosa TaxID=220873 RepID=A0ABQ9FM45_TEGGR|nr:hypothetical protein KUTeg_003429 [Tegillarca granosa]